MSEFRKGDRVRVPDKNVTGWVFGVGPVPMYGSGAMLNITPIKGELGKPYRVSSAELMSRKVPRT